MHNESSKRGTFVMTLIHSEDEKFFSNRALISLILPLVAEQFLALLIGITNTMMVSNISEAAVSSISLVDSINTLLIQLFSAMATGGAIVAAQYLGKRESLNACKAAKQLLYASLFISLTLTLGSMVFCEPILRLFFGELEPATLRYARTYFYLSAMSYPALALYNACAALMRSMGDSKASMFASLVMNVINISCTALFVYGFHMEVQGAGLASLIARTAGAIIVVRLLMNPIGRIHLIQPFRFQFDKGMFRSIVRVGIPNGLENSIFQIGKLLVAGIIATYSVSLVAANAIATHVGNLVNLPGTAVSLAAVSVVGFCIGAGDTQQAKYYAAKLTKVTYAMMAVCCITVFFAAESVAAVFGLTVEATEGAAELLRHYAVFAIVFWPTSFLTPSVLRAAGDAKFTMMVSVLSMWIFRIALSYFFAYTMDLKLVGVWLAMYADWIARSVFFVWRYRSGKWMNHRVV